GARRAGWHRQDLIGTARTEAFGRRDIGGQIGGRGVGQGDAWVEALVRGLGNQGGRRRGVVRSVQTPRELVLLAVVVVPAHPRREFPLVGELIRAVGEQRRLLDRKS